MRVDELFSPTQELVELNPAEMRPKYGLEDVLAAYELVVGEDHYIFYFDACGGKPEEPTFGFGKVFRKHDGPYNALGLKHEVAKAKNPFQVLAAAVQAIGDYLKKNNPLSITFSGAYPRQQEFYTVMTKRFANNLPEGYKLIQREHSKRFYITRNPDLLNMPTSHVIEGRIDELFDKPVEGYELEEIAPDEVRDVRLKFKIGAFDTGYLFNVMGVDYVVFFKPIEGKRGWFDCSFGQYKEGGGILYNLTGSSPRDQFKVFRMVFEGIRRFIETKRPVTIVGGGYIKRQSNFYAKLLQAYENRLPKPYFWAMDAGTPLISRSKVVVPERDHLERVQKPVEEDAAADVTRVRVAERIMNKFIHWLSINNEEAPLQDIMEHSFKPTTLEQVLFASGETIGLPKGFHDLNLGFAWKSEGLPRSNARGWLSPMEHPMGGPRKYLACIVRDTDPSKDTDLAYEMGYEAKEILVHEITHYLDYKRSTVNPGSTQKLIKKRGPVAGYYNSPLEFNAFFQQGLHAILKDLRERPYGSRFRKDETLATFQNFLADNLYSFNHSYREHLDDTYKRKFKRRLYKLYTLIKANPNDPDKVAREAQGFTD